MIEARYGTNLRERPYSFFDEFRDAEFGDQRRTGRFIRVMEKFFERPGFTVNGACENVCEAKAAYRLISHNHVNDEEILRCHREKTFERIKEVSGVVLCSQDTSTITYASHKSTQGLGPVGIGGTGLGLFLHTTEAFTTTGMPLGIIDQIAWSRDIKENFLIGNESSRCVDALKEMSGLQKELKNTRLVALSDRENDFMDYILSAKRFGVEFVLRSMRRATEGKLNIREQFLEERVLCEKVLRLRKPARRQHIGKRDTTKPGVKHAELNNREAVIEIRAKQITILRSTHDQSSTIAEKTVWAIWVREINPPQDFEPVDWMLLTDEDLVAQEDASLTENTLRVIESYQLRWEIETFHKILKSDCKVEMAEFDTLERIKKYLLMMSIIAWRIQSLTHFAREKPEAPCTDLLSEAEWKVLYLKTKKKPLPKKPPTMTEAIKYIASLGGLLGRKGDGEPGAMSIWRGWQRLVDLAEG